MGAGERITRNQEIMGIAQSWLALIGLLVRIISIHEIKQVTQVTTDELLKFSLIAYILS